MRLLGRIIIIVTAVFSLGLIATCVKALAHQFYDYNCCSDRDCFPISFDDIAITPEGYVIRATGTVIPYSDKRIKPTPPEDKQQRFHLCTSSGKPNGMILCLYVPQGGY